MSCAGTAHFPLRAGVERFNEQVYDLVDVRFNPKLTLLMHFWTFATEC
jgi:hypothetical protein